MTPFFSDMFERLIVWQEFQTLTFHVQLCAFKLQSRRAL